MGESKGNKDRGDKDKLFNETRNLLLMGLLYSFFVLVGSYLFLGHFLSFFFDANFIKYNNMLLKILWALPAFVIFTILRSITDSAFKKPLNSYFIFAALISLILFTIFAVYYDNSTLLIFGNTAAYVVMALISLVWFRKIFKK